MQCIIRDLLYCEDKGKLEDADVLISVVRDMLRAKALQIDDGEGHTRWNGGMRWSEESQSFGGLILARGGPRTYALWHANLPAPHVRTVQKHWSETTIIYDLGLCEGIFQQVGARYSAIRAEMIAKGGDDGRVPYFISWDDCAVKPQIVLDQKRKRLVGCCGDKSNDHRCNFEYSVDVSDPDTSYDAIEHAFDHAQTVAGRW